MQGTGREAVNPAGNRFVEKVAVRAPPFWPDEPELWFAQVESQFTLSGITQDSTKYAHTLAQLDSKYAREVRDLITSPPAENKYQELKRALIQRLSASQEQRTRQLLEREELGDRKPSQFLRHLRNLGGENMPEQLLRTLWIGRLPAQMQVILATRARDRLEEVAEQADRIQEVGQHAISEVATTTSDQSIAEQIQKLTRQVAELSRSRKREKKVNQRSRSKSREKKSSGTCYYHRRFKEQARKCTQPCDFQTPKEQGGH